MQLGILFNFLIFFVISHIHSTSHNLVELGRKMMLKVRKIWAYGEGYYSHESLTINQVSSIKLNFEASWWCL